MKQRDLEFAELLTILSEAEAIQFDGTLVYPAVDDYCFGVDVDCVGDVVEYYEDDIDDIIINDYGNIEFAKGTDVYTISVLDVKKLV